jgi:PAS domain-containing protein
MMTDSDVVRRWTRLIGALRTRRRRLHTAVPEAASAFAELVDESLEACAGILQDLAGERLLCERLEEEVHAAALHRQYLLEQIPIACVSTDEQGVIEHANQLAAELLNVSSKHLRGRMLLHFSADRVTFGRLLHDLPVAGGRAEASVPVRPRERGPFQLNMLVVPAGTRAASSWLWFLTPAVLEAPSFASRASEYSERNSERNTA